MKKLIIALAMLAGIVGASSTALAYNPLGQACTAGGNQAAACGVSPTDPLNGPNGVLRKVTQIIAILAGVAAVIMIVVAGLYYVTSDGDSSKISSAKNALMGAIIGLVIVATAQALLTFVLRKVV